MGGGGIKNECILSIWKHVPRIFCCDCLSICHKTKGTLFLNMRLSHYCKTQLFAVMDKTFHFKLDKSNIFWHIKKVLKTYKHAVMNRSSSQIASGHYGGTGGSVTRWWRRMWCCFAWQIKTFFTYQIAFLIFYKYMPHYINESAGLITNAVLTYNKDDS